MTKKAYLLVSGAVFAAVSLLHLLRAINGWELRLGPWEAPMWASWAGFVVAAALALWAHRLNSS